MSYSSQTFGLTIEEVESIIPEYILDGAFNEGMFDTFLEVHASTLEFNLRRLGIEALELNEGDSVWKPCHNILLLRVAAVIHATTQLGSTPLSEQYLSQADVIWESISNAPESTKPIDSTESDGYIGVMKAATRVSSSADPSDWGF